MVSSFLVLEFIISSWDLGLAHTSEPFHMISLLSPGQHISSDLYMCMFLTQKQVPLNAGLTELRALTYSYLWHFPWGPDIVLAFVIY